jgi:DNA-binding transcriptional MerR regulator
MRKAPDAFRTISEAADLLETPAHVLRFWESKFPQIKPVKRAGGRRYYRRVDIDLLSGIKLLLHDQGMTIRGVQKLLAEKGPRHVAELAPFAEDVFEGDVLGAEQDQVGIEFADNAVPDATYETKAAPEPSIPAIAEGPQNVFAGMGEVPLSRPTLPRPAPVAPVTRPPVHAAQLAHILRTIPQPQPDFTRLKPIAARLDLLVARLSAQTDRDRVR